MRKVEHRCKHVHRRRKYIPHPDKDPDGCIESIVQSKSVDDWLYHPEKYQCCKVKGHDDKCRWSEEEEREWDT